ncbi:MAG: PEP-utilizing enzyme [archaeon]
MTVEEVKKRVENYIANHNSIVERMPGILNSISYAGHGIVKVLKKYDLSWNYIYLSLKGHELTIIFSEDIMVNYGKEFLKKELEKPGHYQSLIDLWQRDNKRLHETFKKIDDIGFRNMSDLQLKDLYTEFADRYIEAWGMPGICNNISFCADSVWMPQIMKKYGEEGLKDFITLCTPTLMSFIKQEEEALLNIAIDMDDEKLKAHAEKYHWIKNNYNGAEKLGTNYFFELIEEELKGSPEKKLENLHKEVSELKEKQKKLEKKFTKEENTMAKLVREGTTFQDMRKENNLRANHYVFKFLRETAKRKGYDYEEICYINSDELKRILSGEKINLKGRTKYCIELIELDYEEIISGEEAKGVYEMLENIDKAEEGISEVKGIVASSGIARGTARIVPDVSKVKVFNKGDILIASMTRPEYTTLMKKAAAIVTNEGGITSHASIVSRELGIPCVMGTKIATKIFKDGDMVEVNANKGVVRKI